MVDDTEAGPSTRHEPHEDNQREQTADAAPASGFTYVQRSKRLHGRRARGKKNGAGQQSGEGEEESQPSIEQLLDLVRSKKQALQQGQFGAALEESIDAFARARCVAERPRPSAAFVEPDQGAAASTSTSTATGSSLDAKASAANSSRWIPDRIVALGMGRVSQSRSAQIQLALLLFMADLFEEWSTPASQVVAVEGEKEVSTAGPSSSSPSSSSRPQLLAFDPLSGPTDVALLAAFGVTPASRSQVTPSALFPPPAATSTTTGDQDHHQPQPQPSPVAEAPRTLLYMPHCPRQLYEAYLRASLFPPSSSSPSTPPSQQHDISLLSNRLSRYVDLTASSHRLAREAPALWRTAPYMEKSWIGVPQAKMEVVKGTGEALSDLGFQWLDVGTGEEEKAPTEQGEGEGDEDEDVDVLAQDMATVALAGKGRRRRRGGREASAATDGPPRPDPSTADFWILPEPVPSEADGEVL